MKNQKIFLLLLGVIFMTSCKNQKVVQMEKQIMTKQEQIDQLKQQVNNLQSTNGSLLDRMSDLAIINKTGAESIHKSLESLGQQYGFIQDLSQKIQHKDSLNLALVMNLKRSLQDVNDEDVHVEVRGGIVHVSISDKMLFKSGSSNLSSRAKEVLGKIADVVSDHEELEIMVEGHTDSVPMNNSCIRDNWDLSVKRATSVVRVLEEEHYVDPSRITAAGRSSHVPKSDNDTAEGRSANRRTEIIITPRLDQFFKLLEAPIVAN